MRGSKEQDFKSADLDYVGQGRGAVNHAEKRRHHKESSGLALYACSRIVTDLQEHQAEDDGDDVEQGEADDVVASVAPHGLGTAHSEGDELRAVAGLEAGLQERKSGMVFG